MSSSESDDIAVPLNFWGQRSSISHIKLGLRRKQHTNEQRLKIESNQNKSCSLQHELPSFQKALSSGDGIPTKRTSVLVKMGKRRKKYRKGPIVYSDSESSEGEVSNLTSRDKLHFKSKTPETIHTTNTRLSEKNEYQVTKPNTPGDQSRRSKKRVDLCDADCLAAELELASCVSEVGTQRSSCNSLNDGLGMSRLSADRRSDNDNFDGGIITAVRPPSNTALRLTTLANTQNGEEASSSNAGIPTKFSPSKTRISEDSAEELDGVQMEQSAHSSNKFRISRSHSGLLRRKNYKFAPLIFPRDGQNQSKTGYVGKRGKTSCDLSLRVKEGSSPQNMTNERISAAVNLKKRNCSGKNASLVSSVQERPRFSEDLLKVCSAVRADNPHPKLERKKTKSDQNCSNAAEGEGVADAEDPQKCIDKSSRAFALKISQKVRADGSHLGVQQNSHDVKKANSGQNRSNIKTSCQKEIAVKSLNSVTKSDSKILLKSNEIIRRSSSNEKGVGLCESAAQQQMALASMSELFFGEENSKIKPAPSKKPALNLITEKVSEDSDPSEITLLDDDSLWSSPDRNKSSKL